MSARQHVPPLNPALSRVFLVCGAPAQFAWQAPPTAPLSVPYPSQTRTPGAPQNVQQEKASVVFAFALPESSIP